MTKHYRKFRLLPLTFCLFALIFAPLVRADDTVAILPQFTAFDPPRRITDLTFEDSAGKSHKLSEYKGQLILVNLWATWCIPCRRELPALDRLQTVFKNTKFHIMPISLDMPDNGAKITEFYKAENIKSLPVFRDPDMKLMKELHPDGLPTSYLITADGKAVGKVEGYANWDSEEAANLVEAYLPKGKK